MTHRKNFLIQFFKNYKENFKKIIFLTAAKKLYRKFSNFYKNQEIVYGNIFFKYIQKISGLLSHLKKRKITTCYGWNMFFFNILLFNILIFFYIFYIRILEL